MNKDEAPQGETEPRYTIGVVIGAFIAGMAVEAAVICGYLFLR